MSELTHLDRQGRASMVDVGAKTPTDRRAVAQAVVHLPPKVMEALARQDTPKGDVFAVARVAGIQAAKKTADLIPLCHPLALSRVQVNFNVVPEERVIVIHCTVKCQGRTGVEMEALTGGTVAALTCYDMLKGIDKGMVIDQVRLLAKEGGKSGKWTMASDGLDP